MGRDKTLFYTPHQHPAHSTLLPLTDSAHRYQYTLYYIRSTISILRHMKLMDPASQQTPVSHISWSHVGFGLAFIGFNSAISQVFQLRIGSSLIIAALRCMSQLTVVGAVLQHVLAVKKLWTVGVIACTSFPVILNF
jgi:hypothetical protein